LTVYNTMIIEAATYQHYIVNIAIQKYKVYNTHI